MSKGHQHQWGRWLLTTLLRPKRRRLVRYCINGWCSMGQYGNGIQFVARPERKP